MSKIVTLTAAAVLVAFSVGFMSVAQAASINLSTWTDESIFANHGTPTWVLEGGNLAVKQTINADPSWFVSDFNVQGLTIEGVIEVQTTTDDDYIGFALGFNPGDASNLGADYLLVDWKQTSQAFNFSGCPNNNGTAFIGLAVSRVTGIPTPDELWRHADEGTCPNGEVVELQRATNLGATGLDR